MTRTTAELVADAEAALVRAGVPADDARLEAEVLLAHASGISRSALLARLPDGARAPADFCGMVERRCAREPLAYIVGHREFYGMELACGPGALIPRPETELLVETALGELSRRGPHGVRAVDVGTGTGAVAVAVAATSGAAVLAVDDAEEALAMARRNVERHGLGALVTLEQGDLLAGLGEFDLILANLPYVPEPDWEKLEPEVRDFEPKHALVPGPAGTEAIERLLAAAPHHLAAGGVLAAEVGADQTDVLVTAARNAFPRASIDVRRDLAGLDRLLVVRREGATS